MVIITFKITVLSINPVSLRPSGLAESPLFLIGLALRLFAAEPLFKRDDDFNRCGMMLTIFKRRDSRGAGYVRGGWNGCSVVSRGCKCCSSSMMASSEVACRDSSRERRS